MLLTIERVLILKSVAIFSHVPEEELVDVASAVEEVRVPAGGEILREGELGTSLYVIVEGRVRVHAGEREVAEFGEREVFGELAALDPEPRSASVTALEETLLLQLEGSRLQELLRERAELAQGILKELCRRIRSTTPMAERPRVD